MVDEIELKTTTKNYARTHPPTQVADPGNSKPGARSLRGRILGSNECNTVKIYINNPPPPKKNSNRGARARRAVAGSAFETTHFYGQPNMKVVPYVHIHNGPESDHNRASHDWCGSGGWYIRCLMNRGRARVSSHDLKVNSQFKPERDFSLSENNFFYK